jgi:hypothetical protein
MGNFWVISRNEKYKLESQEERFLVKAGFLIFGDKEISLKNKAEIIKELDNFSKNLCEKLKFELSEPHIQLYSKDETMYYRTETSGDLFTTLYNFIYKEGLETQEIYKLIA